MSRRPVSSSVVAARARPANDDSPPTSASTRCCLPSSRKTAVARNSIGQKLIGGLRASCNKRPVSVEQIEAIADAIERDLQDRGDKEVSSSLIGEKAMARLREADEVAYVRFASVYRSFRDIDEFLAELGKLVKAREAH